jgi:hypothetical protein
MALAHALLLLSAALCGAEGGSPQGLLHLVPGVGLHWYVHSTKTRVTYELRLPADSSSSSSSSSGEGVVAAAAAAVHAENIGLRSTGSKDASSSNGSSSSSSGSSSSRQVRVIRGEGWAHLEKNWGGRCAGAMASLSLPKVHAQCLQ